MQTFLRNNNSNELILLFNGWGMDERPYKPIASSRDILFVSDYTDLELNFDFSKYEKIILMTFSAGAFMAAYLKEKLPKLDLKIALSGNFYLFKDGLGTPQEMLYAMENVSFENALEFRKNLVDTVKDYNLFNKNQPHRTLESSLKEIKLLQEYSKENKTLDFEFDKVIIGKQDKFLPYEHQLKAWNGFKNLTPIEGGHFLFYKFNDFDEIIKLKKDSIMVL